jgi:hypothetical protein
MSCKKKITTALILVISLIMPTAVFANAAPVYLEWYPSFNIAPMDDCPIKLWVDMPYWELYTFYENSITY